MSDLHLPSAPGDDDEGKQPEVRLELTRAGVQQVLSLYSQEQESSRAESGFTLRLEDLTEAIRERRQMLLIGVASGVVLAGLVLLMSTPLYPVSAQVVLERHEVSNTSTAEGPGSASSAFVATQAEVMQSPSVVANAVAAIPRAGHLDPEDNATLAAVEAVHASPVSGTQVVALGYLGPDPAHGVALLGAIVEAYRDALRQNEAQSQDQKLRAKQAEIEVLEAEALAVQERIESLRREHEILGSAEDAVTVQADVLRGLTEQLSQIRSERIGLENRLATGGAQLAILDPATRSLQEQLWQAEAELARVRLTLMPQHPAVEAAQREVTVLRSQLKTSAKATPEALKRDIEATRGLEAQLLSVFELERERMASLERHRRDEEVLQSELERIRNMSDARRRELLDQRLLARLAESGEVGVTARLIQAPMLPESPVWPRPKIVLAGGLLLGLLGGFVAALVSLRQSRDEWQVAPRVADDGVRLR